MKVKPGQVWTGLGTAYVLILTAAVLIRDALRERERIAGIIADTAKQLDERTEEVVAKVERMVASETSATYDAAAWGEVAAEDERAAR